MRIFSETQDSAEIRYVLYLSVQSEIRLYRQFKKTFMVRVCLVTTVAQV